jgi:hypothetical protein
MAKFSRGMADGFLTPIGMHESLESGSNRMDSSNRHSENADSPVTSSQGGRRKDVNPDRKAGRSRIWNNWDTSPNVTVVTNEQQANQLSRIPLIDDSTSTRDA